MPTCLYFLILKVNHPSTAVSSAMGMRQAQGSPSSNTSSIMASSNATTSSAQHSFTLTPLGPHISSGYGSIGGSGGSNYFPPGCGSNSGSRFVNPNQQHHNFDGSFHSTWTTPFGSAGIGRTNYNGIPQFMSSQSQVGWCSCKYVFNGFLLKTSVPINSRCKLISCNYFRFSLEANSKTMWSQTQKDLPHFLLMDLVGADWYLHPRMLAKMQIEVVEEEIAMKVLLMESTVALILLI